MQGQIAVDRAQQRVAETILNEDVLCIAPPGHGKTATAISAIEYFLDNRPDSYGENIVFVSFSRAAVTEALHRLQANTRCKSVLCMTLDSLAGHLNQVVANRGKN